MCAISDYSIKDCALFCIEQCHVGNARSSIRFYVVIQFTTYETIEAILNSGHGCLADYWAFVPYNNIRRNNIKAKETLVLINRNRNFIAFKFASFAISRRLTCGVGGAMGGSLIFPRMQHRVNSYACLSIHHC
jgi:hypothetical protein